MQAPASLEFEETPRVGGPLWTGPVFIAAGLAIIAAIGLLFFMAGRQLPPNTGFLPAYGAATFCIDFITAVLLLAQSNIVRDRARADLGRAYLFSALIIIPHLLSFPGVFAVDPIIGTSSGAVWFWCAWHLGFPLFATFYLRPDGSSRASAPMRILYSIGLTLLIVALLTVVFTAGLPYLPTILVGGNFNRLNALGIGPLVIAANATAAIMAWVRLRSNSSLSICVFVALSISTIDAILTLSGAARFSLGWYVARTLSLTTGIIVLIALMSELLGLLRRTTSVNAQLRLLTATDALTGIANRRQFDQVLDLEWRRAFRSGQRLSVLMIDIDQFKAFNDHYGHPAGDVCLKQVAAGLAATLYRPADLVARIGGEEFAVLLPDTSETGAMDVAQALNKAVAELAISHAASPIGVVTCSIGVSTQRPLTTTRSSAELVAFADTALYQAKGDGRNQARRFADAENEPAPVLVI